MSKKLDLSLTTPEITTYLRDQRTVRVATAGPDGEPHVVPLWFVWHEGMLFMNSTAGNVTVERMLAAGRAAAVVDDGDEYDVLRGVVVTGKVERAGEDPRLRDVERIWSVKYLDGEELPYARWRGRLWLRLVPERIASWDFRKIPAAKAAREAERNASEG